MFFVKVVTATDTVLANGEGKKKENPSGSNHIKVTIVALRDKLPHSYEKSSCNLTCPQLVFGIVPAERGLRKLPKSASLLAELCVRKENCSVLHKFRILLPDFLLKPLGLLSGINSISTSWSAFKNSCCWLL